jgi:putative transposase
MVPNDAGRMVQAIWDEMPRWYHGVDIDAFVVMPNHIHGIIVLSDVGASPRDCPFPRAGAGQAQGPAHTLSLPDVAGRFKSLTANRYPQAVTELGWPPFDKRLW